MSSLPDGNNVFMIESGPEQLQAPDLSIDPGSSPELVGFQGTEYLFFRGAGNNGIWFTSLGGGNWSPVKQITVSGSTYLKIMGATHPSAVVLDTPPRLFLFYTSDQSNGIFYSTTLDTVTWTNVASIVPPNEQWIGIMPNTSPCAIAFENEILLFYTGNGSDGLFSVTSANSGGTWNRTLPVLAQGPVTFPVMNILAGTSPSAVCFRELVYLFFVVGGSGEGTVLGNTLTTAGTQYGNGLWFTTSEDGATWSAPVNLEDAGAVRVNAGTSPTAFVQGTAMYVVWNSDGALQGAVTLDGQVWESSVPFASREQGQSVVGTSVSAVALGDDPTLAWTGPQNAVYTAQLSPVYSLAQHCCPVNVSRCCCKL